MSTESNKARAAIVETWLETVHANNEYGQDASQLWGGWGDDNDLRKLFALMLDALLSAVSDEVCETCAGRGYAYQCDDPEDQSIPCESCSGFGKLPGPLVVVEWLEAEGLLERVPGQWCDDGTVRSFDHADFEAWRTSFDEPIYRVVPRVSPGEEQQ